MNKPILSHSGFGRACLLALMSLLSFALILSAPAGAKTSVNVTTTGAINDVICNDGTTWGSLLMGNISRIPSGATIYSVGYWVYGRYHDYTTTLLNVTRVLNYTWSETNNPVGTKVSSVTGSRQQSVTNDGTNKWSLWDFTTEAQAEYTAGNKNFTVWVTDKTPSHVHALALSAITTCYDQQGLALATVSGEGQFWEDAEGQPDLTGHPAMLQLVYNTPPTWTNFQTNASYHAQGAAINFSTIGASDPDNDAITIYVGNQSGNYNLCSGTGSSSFASCIANDWHTSDTRWTAYAIIGDGTVNSTEKSITVITDSGPPAMSNVQQNITWLGLTSYANFSTVAQDSGIGLNMSWIETNETGSFKNYTDGTYGSPRSHNSVLTAVTVNFTWRNTSTGSANKVIAWRICANDSNGLISCGSYKYIYHIPYLVSYTGNVLSSVSVSNENDVSVYWSGTGSPVFNISMPFYGGAGGGYCNYKVTNAKSVTISNATDSCFLYVTSKLRYANERNRVQLAPELRLTTPKNLPSAIGAAAITGLIVVYAYVKKRKKKAYAEEVA